MTQRVEQQVLGYLIGALDDAEMESVTKRLRTDPDYRRAWQEARRRLGKLKQVDLTDPDVAVPRRLTKRTVDLVMERAQKSGPLAARMRGMSPVVPTRGGSSSFSGRGQGGYRITWADMAIVGMVVLIAGLILAPALQSMRAQARLTACQNNLHNVGMALGQYSQKNRDLFPEVPSDGKLATTGIFASVLARDGLLTEPRWLLCPESNMATVKEFHVASIDDLMSASGQQEMEMKNLLGGSYGYSLGHMENGRLAPTCNRSRDYFAIMADAPSATRPNRQSDNHAGLGQNVLFEDLHVKFLATTHADNNLDDIYENDNHQVAPGVQCDDAVIVGSGTPVMFVGMQ